MWTYIHVCFIINFGNILLHCRWTVVPPVTYPEGIPDRKALRIHSVYVQEAPYFLHLSTVNTNCRQSVTHQNTIKHCCWMWKMVRTLIFYLEDQIFDPKSVNSERKNYLFVVHWQPIFNTLRNMNKCTCSKIFKINWVTQVRQ